MFHDQKPGIRDVESLWQKEEAKNTVNCLHIMPKLRSSEKMSWIIVSGGKEIKWEIQLF